MCKALFKRGLERNYNNKNVLEFDVEKDGGIISWEKKRISLKNIILLTSIRKDSRIG